MASRVSLTRKTSRDNFRELLSHEIKALAAELKC